MKVKLFSSADYQTIEKTMNVWLTANPTIEIQFIAQSQDAGTDNEIGTIAITVWYIEDLDALIASLIKQREVEFED